MSLFHGNEIRFMSFYEYSSIFFTFLLCQSRHLMWPFKYKNVLSFENTFTIISFKRMISKWLKYTVHFNYGAIKSITLNSNGNHWCRILRPHYSPFLSSWFWCCHSICSISRSSDCRSVLYFSCKDIFIKTLWFIAK